MELAPTSSSCIRPCRWLAERLDVGAPAAVNLFETTIRVLGGLLSAQALSAGSHPTLSQRLAEKAAELGARLLPAFDSPSGELQRVACCMCCS
jgi:mannosyl-oligosaccharide alpha-1,2-mannosidase